MILLINLVIVICVKIYRLTKNLAAEERTFIEEPRMFHNTKGCRIYDVFCSSDEIYYELPSDSTSRWTSLPVVVTFPLSGRLGTCNR